MTDLPPGWASGPLSEFIRPRAKKVSPADFPALPFVGMDHVEAHTTKIIGTVPAGQMKSNASWFQRNDVLYGRLRPYLNKVAQPTFDGLASAEFIVFKENRLVDCGFLRYRLHASDFVVFASHLNEGDRPRVSFDQIGTFQVLIPPVREQRRIVERIEVLFDAIDRGVESLRLAKNGISLYRNSLLNAAFEGRLTADWRALNPDELAGTDTLLSRIRGEREAHYQGAVEEWEQAVAEWRGAGGKGKKPQKPRRPRPIPVELMDTCPHGWITVPLGLTIVDPIYGTPKKCGYSLGATGVLRIPNIGWGYIDPSDLKSANFDENDRKKYSLQEGDVLIVRSNGSLSVVGKPAVVQQQHTDNVFAGYLIRIRPISESICPMYLLYLMMEPNVRAQIEAKAKSTSGVNNISAKELQALNVPICSTAEQNEVIRILETRLRVAELLDMEIDASLARADALRQSILKAHSPDNSCPKTRATNAPPTILRGSRPARQNARKEPESSGGRMNTLQRAGSISNSHVCRAFEERTQNVPAEHGIRLAPTARFRVAWAPCGRAMPATSIPGTPKVVLECESHPWTSGGNVPSAKMKNWAEAMFYVHLAPPDFRKIFVVERNVHPGRPESLLTNFLWTQAHMIPPVVEFRELDGDDLIAHEVRT